MLETKALRRFEGRMSKVAQYLQDHIRGSVSVAPAKRQHFAGDASVFRQLPQIIVSPIDEQDVRKVVRFSWQLAEKGKVLPLVARGGGTDLSGASIGQSIVLALQPHLNKTLEFDDKRGLVTVEPGANFGRLQQLLSFSHARYIPAYPQSLGYSTIGGAIANNSGGERSLQFGSMTNYVESLRVVLANGDMIDTKRISKKEVNRKMGMSTFEGEIYRALDALLIENTEVLSTPLQDGRGSLGYDLQSVRHKDGSVDLTPLFVGSQGTLGIVVQSVLSTEPYRPETSRMIMIIKDRSVLGALTTELLTEKPLCLEFVDKTILQLARTSHPNMLVKEIGEELPAGVLVAEFHPMNNRSLDKLIKKYYNKFADSGLTMVEAQHDIEFASDNLKRLPSVLLTQHFASAQLVPGIDDALVPPASVHEFLSHAEGLFQKSGLSVVVNARAGEGIIHAYPLVDLTQLGDRQRLFRLSQDYYKMVLEVGGSVVGEHGSGRLRASYAKQQLGDVVYDLMRRTKQIFDPYGILNPGVKIDVDAKEAFGLLASDYELTQLYHN